MIMKNFLILFFCVTTFATISCVANSVPFSVYHHGSRQSCMPQINDPFKDESAEIIKKPTTSWFGAILNYNAFYAIRYQILSKLTEENFQLTVKKPSRFNHFNRNETELSYYTLRWQKIPGLINKSRRYTQVYTNSGLPTGISHTTLHFEHPNPEIQKHLKIINRDEDNGGVYAARCLLTSIAIGTAGHIFFTHYHSFLARSLFCTGAGLAVVGICYLYYKYKTKQYKKIAADLEKYVVTPEIEAQILAQAINKEDKTLLKFNEDGSLIETQREFFTSSVKQINGKELDPAKLTRDFLLAPLSTNTATKTENDTQKRDAQLTKSPAKNNSIPPQPTVSQNTANATHA